MKKPTTDLGRPRKLALRREAIATLTPPQLARAAGGQAAVPNGDSGGDTPCSNPTFI
jgi:hypothetical protein